MVGVARTKGPSWDPSALTVGLRAVPGRGELAMRLGFAPPPRPRGRMHACFHEYSATLIPIDRATCHALMHFAASYTEPDSS